MADVDPRDFIAIYLVEVKLSALSDTTLTREDFDESEYDVILGVKEVRGELHVEFTTRRGAEKVVDKLNQEVDSFRDGRLNLRSAHPTDGSEVDAYLLFRR